MTSYYLEKMSSQHQREAQKAAERRRLIRSANRPRESGAEAPAPAPATVGSRLALVIAALGVLYIVWGSTYLGIRIAIDTIPPLLMASVRFALAGVVLYAWAVRRGDSEGDRPGRRQWMATAVVGVLLLAGGNGGVTWGEQFVPTGIAALLIARVPRC